MGFMSCTNRIPTPSLSKVHHALVTLSTSSRCEQPSASMIGVPLSQALHTCTLRPSFFDSGTPTHPLCATLHPTNLSTVVYPPSAASHTPFYSAFPGQDSSLCDPPEPLLGGTLSPAPPSSSTLLLMLLDHLASPPTLIFAREFHFTFDHPLPRALLPSFYLHFFTSRQSLQHCRL